MIAINPEPQRRAERESVYTLRRLLVRQLQKATQGVSRRERIHTQRRFAEEWQQRGSYADFRPLIDAISTGRGEESGTLLLDLAQAVYGQRHGLSSPSAPAVQAGVNPPGRRALPTPPASGPTGGRPLESGVSTPVTARQGELFDLLTPA